jgi:6-phosphogluconate dehydrogenase (decarboxylating)
VEYLEVKELKITYKGIEIIFLIIEQNTLITSNGKTKKIKVLFLKIILNPKDNKTLRNLIAKFYKDKIVWIMVLIKKVYNYILRAKAIELKLKGELVVDNKVNKANKVDLPLNNLLVSSVNNIKIIIKTET